MCGGTRRRLADRRIRNGLSPRVRGNPNRYPWEYTLTGSIPACAGEPRSKTSRAARSRVYPRVCGGTSLVVESPSRAGGLSPRVRGNLKRCLVDSLGSGSIPACAGEPQSETESEANDMVYPRVCGGTRPRASPRRGWSGLSPRVRGNRLHRLRHGVLGRSIPACAGEPTRVYHTDFAQAGLSPRVRGNQAVDVMSPGKWGSIPACAGEPRRVCTSPLPARVYPRVCGGTRASV